MTKLSQATSKPNQVTKDNNRARVAVVGVGNVLLKDEGIGVHVARALHQAIGTDMTDVSIIDGGTSPETFMLLEGIHKLIVVDAVHGGSAPGSVYRFHLDDITADRKYITSLHQIGVLDGLQMMRLCDIEPDETVIIGIEPKEIGWGLELSAELSKKLPQIIKVVTDELDCGKNKITEGKR